MIAKRIASDPKSKPGPAGYARLARYIVDARGKDDPRTWQATADYILDANHSGAKVGGVRVTNCGADDPALATLEIMATQQKNTRSKREKIYHLVFSFPEGERPPLATLHAIEDRLCEAIGMAHHQRISAVHVDTAQLHVHVAINKVDPYTFRNIEPFYDKRRLMEECDRLEQRFGLQRTNHGITQEQDNERRHERIRFEPTTNDAHRIALLRKSYAQAMAEGDEAESIDAVRDLSSVDVVRTPSRSPDVLLQASQDEHMDQPEAARSELLRRLRNGSGRPGGETIRINGPAGDFEANAGIESLIGFAKRTLVGELSRCGSWKDAHEACARHGVELRLRGAGLVVVDPAARVGARASSIDRGLSLGQLQKRWGAFEPSAERPATPRRTRPLHGGGGTPALHARYTAERSQAQAQRAHALRTLREKHAAERDALAAHYKAKRRALLSLKGGLASLRPSHREKGARPQGAPAPVRAAVITQIRALAAERAREAAALRTRHAAERAEAAKAAPLPGWQDWLRAQADRGDPTAARTLRTRQAKQERWLADWISAQDAASASAAARADLSPSTDKRGRVVYRLADGGRVVDAAQGVRVAKTTDAAAFLALELATKRYAGQALQIDGSDAFKRAVVRTAAEKRLDVRFADPALAAMFAAARKPQPAAPTSPPPKPVEPAPPAASALADYVAERNAHRAPTSTIGYYRPWAGSDAGPAVYRGRRRLSDGSECVLLERDGTMLVMGVTSNQAARASTWKLGTSVTVDARGRFTHVATRTGPNR